MALRATRSASATAMRGRRAGGGYHFEIRVHPWLKTCG